MVLLSQLLLLLLGVLVLLLSEVLLLLLVLLLRRGWLRPTRVLISRLARMLAAALVMAGRVLGSLSDGGRGDVESCVDGGRDGLDLCSELLLDSVEVEPVLVREQVDGDTEVTESTRSSDSVEVRLGSLGEVLTS